MSSRSLDFADEIRAITGGEGVDLVLNSLAGEFISEGLSVTKPGGCFVEIGRAGIWSAEQVARLGTGIDYHPVMLGDVGAEDPALIQALGAEILAGLADGSLEPLPVRSFPMEDAAEAYRFMAQANHTGKLVLTLSRSAAEASRAARVGPEGGYLVTGGFGALGLEVARWLVAGGARHLVLMGRSGADDRAIEVVGELRQAGAEVQVVRGDVTRERDLRRVLRDLERAGLALRGIVHTAGVVDDGVLSEQSWERLDRVLAAKVTGTWILHELTEGLDLDLFVLFSSAASLFGSAGQAGYAAANAFVDALARWRRRQDLVATSVDWGPWAGRGMFAEGGEATRRSVLDRGFRPMSPARALGGLENAIRREVGRIGVFSIDWSAYRRWLGGAACPPLFDELVSGRTGDRAVEARPDAFVAELTAAPAQRRAPILQRRLRVEVAHVLGSEPATLSSKQGFRELGMDSLMSVELRNRLERLLGCSLRSTLAFDYPNLAVLTDYLLREALELPAAGDGVADGASGGDATPTVRDDVDLDELAALSNDEAERLLLEELTLLREAEGDG